MSPADILSHYSQSPEVREIISRFRDSANHDGMVPAGMEGDEPQNARRFRLHLENLCGSSRAVVTAAVFTGTSHTHLAVIPDKEEAAYFFNDLQQFLKDRVFFFPSSFKKGLLSGAKDNQGLLSRTEVLNLLNGKIRKCIIVTYPEALAEKVVSKKFLEKNTLKLTSGEMVNMEFILDLLIEYDFERTDFVSEPGQFSIRGGLIDAYSFSHDHPYRIEFDGDRVASLRSFDPSTQLSIQKMEEITIVPDIRVDESKKVSYESLFSFLPPRSVVWLSDPVSILHTTGGFTASDLLVGKEELLRSLLNFSTVETGSGSYFRTAATVSFNTSPQPSFGKNFDLLLENLKENLSQGYRNFLLADNPKQTERLKNILDDIQLRNAPSPGNLEKSGGEMQQLQQVMNISLHEGFLDHSLKVALYTDHQIFERYHRFQLRDGYTSKEALKLKELYDLKPGDYVTHIDHGVGRFDGLEKIINNGKEQEAIRLIYKNDDLLYVSIHSLHRVSKYIGKEGTAPSLNRLGSDTWNKLRNKTKSKVKDIARELIRLYAERRAASGLSCSPDTYLQNELEASFIYEDTPDQIKATGDVKKDLEATFPMDRLICGDVGFGKTEIAIRATFKVVTESRQVAVLVPTTILALQHYKTFSERLKSFPCRVEYINRFKSAAEQKTILADLAQGKIDVIIGTHRLLSKDIVFKNLGLLVVDEEQKFGVGAKEKIKMLRVNVDTLTLTATPIPRTLQFSLMGARDLSIINTPPPNRFPVQTEIHPFGEEIIREAIKFEVQRGGQVFFVTTRVMNILEIATMVQRMVPNVRVAVAHGQMEGHKLEKVMVDFIEGEYDVLIATTIIESGLDISNVNTIIINDAHHYGLSDLHQLRGRVGRSNKKAFCYLLAPPMSTLTDEARKRLRAIEEFAELGSGFNIAMRDLDIRGAGNILGAEQSGFISEIGFEMYQKILDEALLELKESDFRDLFTDESQREFVHDCVIETDLEILIPDSYITSVTERLGLYKELDSIENEEELNRFRARLCDRFGPMPPQTDDLLHTIRLRRMAKKIGFEKLVLRNGTLTAYFVSNPESDYFQSLQFTAILELIKKVPSYCRMKEEKNRLFVRFATITGVSQAIEKLEAFQISNVTNI